MGDFAGMDPEGVRRLKNALGELALKAADLRRSMNAAIAEAGPDWAGDSTNPAPDRTRTFATETAKDLNWRLELLLRLEGGDGSPNDFVSGNLPFADRLTAQRTGRTTGAEGRRLWDAYKDDPSEENAQALANWLRTVGVRQAADPEFAGALAQALGAANLVSLMTMVSSRGQRAGGIGAQSMEELRAELQPLAQVVASMEAGGRLPADLRKVILGEMSPDALGALITFADQPTSLLVPATRRLLDLQPGNQGATWNTYWAVRALGRNPDAIREILNDEGLTRKLLDPRVQHTAVPGFRHETATALEAALSPTSGEAASAANTRRDAFINLINLLADKNYWPSLQASPINMVLARRSGQYFDQLGGVTASEHTGNMQYHPGPPWGQVTSGEVGLFFGALMQDAGAYHQLRGEYRKYLSNLDFSDAAYKSDHPDPAVRDRQKDNFIWLTQHAGGIGSSLLDGVAVADLAAEHRREAMADMIGLSTGYVGEFAGPAGPGLDAAVGAVEDPVREAILRRLDETDPEVSEQARLLIDEQAERAMEKLEQQGMPRLTRLQEDEFKDNFQGLYFESVVNALKARHG